MQLIGRIGRRKVYYVQIRNNAEWKSTIPKNDWIAFTVSDKEDEELIPPAVKVCIDKNVCYTCSGGTLSEWTEEYFDEEIAYRAVDYEQQTGKEYDYKFAPVTTAHSNFSQGFWFASTIADSPNNDIEKVVCLDFTKRKVKKHLIQLVEKINNGWLPPDKEHEPEA